MTTKALNPGNSSTNLQPWTGNPGLQKLCTLLRNEGDKVLNGNSFFTLTTEVLAQLNTDCRRHSITENDIATPDIAASRSFMPLTSRLRAQQKANKAKVEWSDHIQFIKDFMLSTPSFKLIRYSGTLSSPISLHRFGNLTSLNLRKVPIHMVEGLHKLRGTLVSITVYRSVDKVKDLLEFCGGDMTSPMVWPQLKYVSFMFNSISTLDDSLRLLPHVEVIDLSHNSLETCDKFLEYLNDVQRITLAYNFLTRAPLVSSTTRASLVCLVLRGNNLDNMKGIEALTALQILDMGENCISDHNNLNTLGFLIRLKQLQLDGNPVFYHKLHRPLTAARLASQAVSVEFELDKRKLTVSEISKAQIKRITAFHQPSLNGVRLRVHTPDSDYGLSPSSGIGTENDSSESVVSHKGKKKSKPKKARHTKIVNLDNSCDASSSQDVTPGTSPHLQALEQQLRAKRDEAMQSKKKIDELRKHYGPNWLQAIEDRDIFNRKEVVHAAFTSEPSDAENKNTESENTESDNNSTTKFFIGSKSSNSSDIRPNMSRHNTEDPDSQKNGFPTHDDLYLTDTRLNDINNPIMAAIARLAAGHSASDVDDISKSSLSVHPQTFETQAEIAVVSAFLNTTENGGIITTMLSVPIPVIETAAANTDENVVDASKTKRSAANLERSDHGYVSEPISTLNNWPQPTNDFSAKQNGTSLLKHTEIASSKDKMFSKTSTSDLKNSTTASTDTSLSELEAKSFSSSVSLDKEEVTESMFATLPLQGNKIIIMTLTALYLIEKDISGNVTEKLELASLAEMKWKEIQRVSEDLDQALNENLESEFESTGVVTSADVRNKTMKDDKTGRLQLDLKFDYVRKDRQSRHYIVDFPDGKVIIVHLQSFLNSREEKERAQAMIIMQCLKCNRTFMESELIQQRSLLPTSGSSKDLQSIKELMNNTMLICPKCGSSLIIELEPSSSTVKSSTTSSTSTPVGSYTSTAGSYIDQAKKSANSGKKNIDRARDSKFGLRDTTSVRDRNRESTIPQRMSKSVIVASGEQKISFEDELECVEDHFSANAMTSIRTPLSRFDEMTTSLEGDSSTRGSRAPVKRSSVREAYSGFLVQKEASILDLKQRILLDSGYESGIINGVDEPTRPISIERRVSNFGDDDKDEEKLRLQSGLEQSSVHKNLATMENIVNSLVNEGKYLEEQESFGANLYSSSKGKSVSISAFINSSRSHNRKTSICSVEGSDTRTGLKHCESSSSIAVIPVLSSSTTLDTLNAAPTFSTSLPVYFSNGALIDGGDFKDNSETAGNAVVSPLSSSICSSMVSSVYETSMNNSESKTESTSFVHQNGGDFSGTDNVDAIQSAAGGDIIVVESISSSSEDLTSIYDHPREPKSSIRRKQHSKLNPLSIPTAISPEGGDPALSSSGLSSNLQVGSETTTQEQSSRQLTSLPNTAGDLLTASDLTVDDDSDEVNDQDVVPQYSFHHLNHRLTLYMMMSLFGTDEEFVCKLQGEIVQYIIQKSYEGILVLSSSRFYILKITSEDHSQPPDHWLQCTEIQPIPELHYIDVGLGGQSLRLEFVTDCSSYTFITRNRDKTAQFVDMLHTNLAKYAVSQGIASHVLVNEDVDQTTLNNLDRDIVSKVTPDQKMLYYCMGFIERGNQKHFPISFVITTCDICLVCANHQWPQPRLQTPISEETVGKQFTVLERQKISNVASVEVCEATMKKIKLELFNEMEGISTNWNITMATRQSTVDFINALSEPWAKEFGVEMDVVYAVLPF